MNYKINRNLNTIFLLASCFFSFVVATTAQTYTVISIGTLGGNSSSALDLNENGYVVGNSENAEKNQRGFVYKIEDGTKTAISTFGGLGSYVNATNNNNQVVGKAETENGDFHAFLYDIATGTLTDLHPAVSLGGLQSSAVGINDNGLVVGWAELADGNARGFVYNPATGVRTEIGTFGGALSVAFDINNNNIVAGMAQVSDTVAHAFSYNVATAALTDLGTLGGNEIDVSRINNSNQIIGSSATSTSSENARGFRSSIATINPATDMIPTLGGIKGGASGINDAGDVVGQANRADGFGKAFLFRNNVIKNLNTIIQTGSGWDLWEATAINNSGQIVGKGIRGGTLSQAFLLLPESANCSYSINPTSSSVVNSASTGNTIEVNALPNCGWAVKSNDSWITVTSESSGNGNRTVSYSVTANYGAQRTGTITIAGQTFTVTQAAACTFILNPIDGKNAASSGTTSSFSVSTQASCAWTASTNSSWITLSGTSGTGNGIVTYSFGANPGAPGRSRKGFIDIKGDVLQQTFQITQLAVGCPSLQTISAGQSINGNLQDGDCIFDERSTFSDAYTFNGTIGQKIYTTLDSTSFYPYLRLYQGTYTNATSIASNSNGASYLTARIPQTSGYFTLPATGTYTILVTSINPNQTGNYTLSLGLDPSTYTINGQITSNGNASSGVAVSLSGSATASTTTDSSGNYSFASLTAGGNYTITPTLANNTFTPVSSTFSNLSANQTANFAAVPVSTPTPTPTPAPTPNLSDQNHLDSSYYAGVTESNTRVSSTAVQTNGKIIVGGTFTKINDAPRRFLERFNEDGTRDSEFNGGGSGINGAVAHVVLQSNAKILVGGNFSSYNGVAATRNILRLNSDGSLDSTFNGGTGADNSIQKIAILADGKILIGGYFTTYNGVARNRIARLNADGSLDAAFDPGTGANNFVDEIVVQPGDGRIIIAGGFSTINGVARSTYARLNTDGSIDASFNIGTVTSDGNNVPQMLGAAIQANGKILLGGSFNFINGTRLDGLVRLNSDGSIDTGFTRPFGAYIQSIVIDSSGKILIGGSIAQRKAVLRLNDNGSIDTGFQATTSPEDVVSDISVQSNGKLVIGGPFTKYGDAERRYLVRADAAGTLDSTFDIRLSKEGVVRNIASQPDGKNIVTGNFLFANGVKRSNIVRFNADSSLDTSFVPGFTDSYQPIITAAVQADGKILIGGTNTQYGGVAIKRLARLNPSGTLDTTFNNALLPTPPEVGVATVQSIKVQTDNKILVGGNLINAGGTSQHFARLNLDGSLDAAFVANIGAGANGPISDIEIQPDGGILISGSFTAFNGAARNRIARLNADGNLDATFTSGSGANSNVLDSALQSDGKVVIGGEFTTFNGVGRNRIARLNADGSLDASFSVGTGANSTVNSVAVQPNGKIFIGGFFSAFNGAASLRLARLNINGALDASFASRLQTDASIYKVFQQSDGKMLVGGIFNLYAGVARNGLARLTETVPASSVATQTGQSIVVSTTDATLNFSNVSTAGNTVVTAMSPNQLQPIPAGYILPAGTPIYDITTTAVFSGGINVSLKVPNVADATACSRLRILHYTNNAWDVSHNAAPSYDSGTGICTVSQTVTSLSPFAVVQIIPTSHTISGQITAGGNALQNVSVALSGSALATTLTDTSGNYSFTVNAGGSYTVTPTLANYTFTPVSSSFNTIAANQTSNFNAVSSCSYSINPTSVAVGSISGTGSLRMVSGSGCAWTAVSNNDWLSVVSGANGSGEGTISYSVTSNGGVIRTGTISVAGQTFTVTQAAAALTFEADVAPRGAGDGAVSSTDVSIIQGFQLGLGAPYQSNEFQRADCSPFETRGDGQISSIDVSQAQAYQLGLNRTVENTLQSASGPLARLAAVRTTEAFLLSRSRLESAASGIESSNESSRRVRVGLMTGVAGQTITIPIEVDALGDESVYGFSIGYDAAKLSNPSVTIGNAGGAVLSNAREAGRIGVSVGFGGGVIAAGTGKVLINVRLTIAANAEAGASAIRLTDEPTIRGVASGAESAGGVRRLASEFVDGAVMVTAGGKSRKRARFF